MFADDYLELLGIVDPAGFTNNLDRLLEERGEGLLGVALGSRDAAGTHAAWAAPASPPRHRARSAGCWRRTGRRWISASAT
jgi:hypothetical protein